MRTIQLTQGYETLVDNVDYDSLMEFMWCVALSPKPYAVSTMGKRQALIRMHRYLLGVTDRYIKIDHKDGNSLNNRRDNIRIATDSQNNINTVKYNSSSGYRGVSQNPVSRRWQAAIRNDIGKAYIGTFDTAIEAAVAYIGTFDTAIEAAVAYDNKARELHGEFAMLNFP